MSESSLAPQVVRQFTEKGLTLGTAESLTAGLIAATVADVSGASAGETASAAGSSVLQQQQGFFSVDSMMQAPFANPLGVSFASNRSIPHHIRQIK